MIHNLTNIFDTVLLESLDFSSISSGKYEGWFGTVYKIDILDKSYALKIFKDTMHDSIANKDVAVYDYEVLETLNFSSHYPTLHAYRERKWMLVDWVDGVPFRTVPNKDAYFSQIHNAYKDAVKAGWFPDDIKGDNIVHSNGSIVIIDVGSYLPTHHKVNYIIRERVEFIIKNAHKYPSVRDKPPYIFKEHNLIRK